MTGTITFLIAVLAVWMLACAWCGFRARFVLFLGVLIFGLALDAGWIVFGLHTQLLDPHAMMAQAAVALYGICAFGAGWLAGRIVRQWRDSRVNRDQGEN